MLRFGLFCRIYSVVCWDRFSFPKGAIFGEILSFFLSKFYFTGAWVVCTGLIRIFPSASGACGVPILPSLARHGSGQIQECVPRFCGSLEYDFGFFLCNTNDFEMVLQSILEKELHNLQRDFGKWFFRGFELCTGMG